MLEAPYTLTKPSGPLLPILISSPHSGTEIPSFIRDKMQPDLALDLPDTDWFVHELYGFAPDLGITVVQARYSRFVIDLNRDPEGQTLYRDGRQETGLVPVRTFGGVQIYKSGLDPQPHEIKERLQSFYQPYHHVIHDELAKLQRQFKQVLFFDAHSIARVVKTIQAQPFPDLILGNQHSKTAAPTVIAAALAALQAPMQFSVSHNEPFMGGYLTRSLGKPHRGVHALQLEMSQDIYLTADRTRIDPLKRHRLEPTLKKLFLDVAEALRCL